MISDMGFKKMCNGSPTMCAKESILVIEQKVLKLIQRMKHQITDISKNQKFYIKKRMMSQKKENEFFYTYQNFYSYII